MKSPVIKAPQNQLTLSFEPGLAEKHRSLRECIAVGIYQRGLSSIAIDLKTAGYDDTPNLATNFDLEIYSGEIRYRPRLIVHDRCFHRDEVDPRAKGRWLLGRGEVRDGKTKSDQDRSAHGATEQS